MSNPRVAFQRNTLLEKTKSACSEYWYGFDPNEAKWATTPKDRLGKCKFGFADISIYRYSVYNQDTYYSPHISTISPRKTVTEQRFRVLRDQWKMETRFLSSVSAIAMHPAYQQIIGMGWNALPFIFDDLRRERNHWFWALRAITGEEVVSEEAQGNIDYMAKAWIAWGKERGL